MHAQRFGGSLGCLLPLLPPLQLRFCGQHAAISNVAHRPSQAAQGLPLCRRDHSRQLRLHAAAVQVRRHQLCLLRTLSGTIGGGRGWAVGSGGGKRGQVERLIFMVCVEMAVRAEAGLLMQVWRRQAAIV